MSTITVHVSKYHGELQNGTKCDGPPQIKEEKDQAQGRFRNTLYNIPEELIFFVSKRSHLKFLIHLLFKREPKIFIIPMEETDFWNSFHYKYLLTFFLEMTTVSRSARVKKTKRR